MMKRIATYIFYFLMLGLLNGCKQDELAENRSSEEQGGPVTLNVSVVIPEPVTLHTRALLDEAAEENKAGYLSRLIPYMFIFEDTGNPESNYLRTLVHGEQIKPDGTDYKDEEHSTVDIEIRRQNFKATVDGTAENAIIHLVLIQEDDKENFEAQLANMTDRNELGMFSGSNGLYTKKATYWKRIVLGCPINNSSESQAVLKSKLDHIKMVRNFAQVMVNTTVPTFQIEGFAVVNAMDCGYVAAYNENTGTAYDNFVDFENNNKPVTYGHLSRDVQYVPIRHPAAERVNKDNQTDWVDGLTWDKMPKYTFERPVQNNHRTFVVIKAYRTDIEKTEYYKLDIGGYDNLQSDPIEQPYGVFELYQLIRNISYNITITAVHGHGYADAKTAIGSVTSNNISASIDTQNVMSISDSYDFMSIYIKNIYPDNQTAENDGLTVVIVKDDNGDLYPDKVQLRWQYYDGDIEGYNNDDVKHDYPGYDLKTGPIGMNIIKDYQPWTDATDWKGYELTFNPPNGAPLQETVKFYKPGGLSRDVTFILRDRWKFVTNESYKSNIEVYPGAYSYENGTPPPYNTLEEMRANIPVIEVGSQRGAQFTVMFELPGDIPQVLFPLTFKIGFDRQNAENAYFGNATVVYGESMFKDDYDINVPRMQFEKTVTWEYYNGSGDPGDNGHKIVCARFMTTTDVLAELDVDNISKTKVRVYNPYFELGEDEFQRKSHEDVIDPTRTRWYWNFSYPEWSTYFNTYPDATGYDPHNMDNLSFVNYSTGNTSGYGTFLSIGLEDSDMNLGPEYDATKENPEFSFPVDFNIDDYTGGELIVQAAAAKGRDNRFDAQKNVFGTVTKYGFNLYDRDVHAAVVLSDNQIIDLVCTSDGNRLYHRCTQTDNTGTFQTPQDGFPRDPVFCKFSLSAVPAESNVKEIRVWGQRTVEYSTANYEYILKGGKTNFYSIEFTLTPKQ